MKKPTHIASTFYFLHHTMRPHQKIKRACKPSHSTSQTNSNLTQQTFDEKKQRTANSTYKKLVVQWLNEALCFVSSSVLADSLVLRNRQLLVAAKR